MHQWSHCWRIVACLFVAPMLGSFSWSAPPRVIKAIPDHSDIGVDPNLKEVRITFDQAMSSRGHSIVGGGESFPKLVGREPGKWRGARTFTLRVQLKPSHSYWLSVNSEKFQNFRNRQGEPAVPYPIQFTTGTGQTTDEAAHPEVAGNAAAVDQLKRALATRYSHRDRLNIDWSSLVESQRKRLESARDSRTFARLAATLLSKAQDKHLWLKVGDETFPTYVRPVTPNVNRGRLPQRVPQWKEHSPVLASGQWKDGIGYLLIDTWDRERTRELAPVFEILERLKDAPALIVDVRGNGGGDERIARSVAGCFVDKPVLYAQHVVVDPDQPNGFSAPHRRMVQPNTRRTAYRGKIAVLTGPVNMSSCEAFLLMMRQAPDTVLVGAKSQGSSGNPQPLELDNGVTLFLPSWKAMTPDGIEFEGVGIPPDVPVIATPKDLDAADPVVEAALAHLRSQLAES